MKTWFHSTERIQNLTTEASRWLGTPFRANAAIKGAGVCCHLLVTEIFTAIGAIPRQAFPAANPNHSISQRESLIEPFMNSFPRIREIEDAPLPGDILGFKIGGCTHHLSIVLPNREMIHAVRRHGVMLNRWDDPMWQRRLTRTWRLEP